MIFSRFINVPKGIYFALDPTTQTALKQLSIAKNTEQQGHQGQNESME